MNYAECLKAAKDAEYAWIDGPTCQEISDELDRVMTLGYGIGQRWRDLYQQHGREIACTELMYEKDNIACALIRRKEQRAKEERRYIIWADLRDYLEKREQFCTQNKKCTRNQLKELDANFITEQKEKGHLGNEWLDEFGTTIHNKLATLQGIESFWYEHLEWEAEKKRRAKQDEIEQEQKLDKAFQRLATLIGDENRAIAKELFMEVMLAK